MKEIDEACGVYYALLSVGQSGALWECVIARPGPSPCALAALSAKGATLYTGGWLTLG